LGIEILSSWKPEEAKITAEKEHDKGRRVLWKYLRKERGEGEELSPVNVQRRSSTNHASTATSGERRQRDRITTPPGDCHGGMFEMGSNGLLKEIEEGDEGEAILSCRGFVALI
jgi:hypothetical protein